MDLARFFESLKKAKIGLKNRLVREVRGKITVFHREEGNDFWFELSEGLKPRRIAAIEKLDFHCIVGFPRQFLE